MILPRPSVTPSSPAAEIDIDKLLAAAKRRAGANKKIPTVGVSLIAAIIAAESAESAQARGEPEFRTFDSGLRGRLCDGHAFIRAARSVASFVSSEGSDHSQHAADSFNPELRAFMRSAHAQHDALSSHDAGGHTVARSSSGGKSSQSTGRGRGRSKVDPDQDDSTQGGATGGSTGGSTGVATGGHQHPATGGATTGGATSGATTGGATNPSLPHPTDPGKQAEHIEVMALVKVSAATHIAVKSGSWFDPATWANGQVPGDGAKVVIPQGLSVAYDGSSKVSLFTVRVDGALDFATDRNTFMEVDTFVVAPTGSLTIGTETNPVDPSVKAVISIANNGPIDVAWDPTLLSRGFVSHGHVEIHGAEKETFLKVAVDPMKGDTTLTLESAPTGWQVGDKLVLTGTHLASTKGVAVDAPVNVETQDEELVITAINGNVITLDHALKFNHDGARADLKAYVANYSRNVVFETENAANVPTSQRGHVMFMHSDDLVVKFAEFSELGRTDKSQRAFDVADLTAIAPDSNLKGRYSFHIHQAGVGDAAHPAIVEGNAVFGSPGWGFVQHDSNAILANNAAYDVFGAGFVAETGNEIGRWVDNISIKSLGVNHITKHAGDVHAFDMGRTGTGFWFQGRLVEAVGNVAASVPSGAGFTYFHRGSDTDQIPILPGSSQLADSLRYNDSVRTNTPNISLFLNNESIATQTGLEVIKANPKQDHDVRSVIEGFTAWEVSTGVHLEYTGHYTFVGLDVVATDNPLLPHMNTIGLDLSKTVYDVVVNGGDIAGFYTGVRQTKDGISEFDKFDALDIWGYVYIDVKVTGAQTAFTNITPSDKFLTASDLTLDRLVYQSAFPETMIKQVNGVFNLRGTKTDSIGATESYKPWDPNYINITELRGSIEQNGFWRTADGRRVALIEEYVSDRATGDLIKVGLFVEIPAKYSLRAGGFTRIDAVDNGLLNVNSKAPTAVDDFASVKQGHSVVINVLANDSDPDGDKIKLDGLFSQHGHIVANGDGTVTYFADPGFSGVDTFKYFVQDTNGDISWAQVSVTVDI